MGLAGGGGLSILAAYNNNAHKFLQHPNLLLASQNFKSVIMLLAIVLAISLLAYLTNPSETSFRKFLTELAFRHHLTRLTNPSSSASSSSDDTFHSSSFPPASPSTTSHPNNITSTAQDPPPTPRSLSTKKSFEALTNNNNQQRFQFSSRASVSLRTPAHVFRSFWIFTIAVVSPVTPGGAGAESALAGSWFIGAFGAWWMGGRVVQRSRGMLSLRSRKGEEVGVVPSRVGLVGFRSLDEEDGYEGYKLIADPFHNPHNSLTPPRGLRNRSSSRSGPGPHPHHGGTPNNQPHGQKQQQQHGPPVLPPLQAPPRSSTPPPLPVSASLPLHNAKGVVSVDHHPLASIDVQHPQQQQNVIIANNNHESSLPPPTIPNHHHQRPVSRQPSFESSPLISELMSQLSNSQNTVNDLRAQLSSFETSSSSVRGAGGLEAEVEVQRAKKRTEDAARLELRAKIKALEEEKRNAEAVKREGDKKVRSAHTKREDVERRLERLRGEMVKMRTSVEESAGCVTRSAAEVGVHEGEMEVRIEGKKREIEVCERVLGALNDRVREVEGLIEEEKRAMGNAERRMSQRMFWPPQPAEESNVSPRPRPLSLTNLGSRPPIPIPQAQAPPQPAEVLFHSRFSPFDMESAISPATSMGLIPSGIMESPRPMEDDHHHHDDHFPETTTTYFPESTNKGETGSYFLTPPPQTFALPTSPMLLPVENRFDAQRATIRSSVNAPLAPLVGDEEEEVTGGAGGSVRSRRWFSRENKDSSEDPHAFEVVVESNNNNNSQLLQPSSKKGLNPDAKSFKFTRRSSFLNLRSTPNNTTTTNPAPPAVMGVDPLNPSGPSPAPPPTPRSSFFTSLRAFQPSPAEREALRLAMEGSNGSSLERISSRGSGRSVGAGGGSPTPLFATHSHLWSEGGGDGETTAVPQAHKKSFTFNTWWGQDKLLGSKGV